MIRTFALAASLGLTALAVPTPSVGSDLEQARQYLPLVLADLHFAERNCPSFHVDRASLDLFAQTVLGPKTLNDEPHQSVYLERAAVVASLMLSERMGAICGQIWSLYGPTSKLPGYATLLPHIRFTPADTYKALLDHFRFDMSGFEKTMQSRMRSALGKVFDACSGLDVYTEVISADRIEYIDYGHGHTIDYEGSREPWGPMFRVYFKVADDAEGAPPIWNGHTFGIYVNNDMSELIPTKHVGNALCGRDGASGGIDRVMFLK